MKFHQFWASTGKIVGYPCEIRYLPLEKILPTLMSPSSYSHCLQTHHVVASKIIQRCTTFSFANFGRKSLEKVFELVYPPRLKCFCLNRWWKPLLPHSALINISKLSNSLYYERFILKHRAFVTIVPSLFTNGCKEIKVETKMIFTLQHMVRSTKLLSTCTQQKFLRWGQLTNRSKNLVLGGSKSNGLLKVNNPQLTN